MKTHEKGGLSMTFLAAGDCRTACGRGHSVKLTRKETERMKTERMRSSAMLKLFRLALGLLLVGAGLPVEAQDKDVEFGAEDDLTVLGVAGDISDADLEVKGFSVFGDASGLLVPAAFSNGAGTVIITSNLWVQGILKSAGGIDMSSASMTVSNLEVRGYLHAQGSFLEVTTNALMKASLTINRDLAVDNNATVNGALSAASASIGGAFNVGGQATLATNVVVQSTTESSGPGNGALVVGGGAGIGRNLNVGGNLSIAGSTLFDGSVDVGGVLTLLTNMVVKSTKSSADKDSGAVVVDGGVGIEENLNVGGAMAVGGNTAVGGTLGVTGSGVMQSNLTIKGNLMVWETGTFSNHVTAVKNAYLATEGMSAAVGVGTVTPDANTKLDVRGGENPGDYAVKIYVGADVAAWVRKK